MRMIDKLNQRNKKKIIFSLNILELTLVWSLKNFRYQFSCNTFYFDISFIFCQIINNFYYHIFILVGILNYVAYFSSLTNEER